MFYAALAERAVFNGGGEAPVESSNIHFFKQGSEAETMKTFRGKGVFGGIAIGRISLNQRKEQKIKRYHIEDVLAETERFHAARDEAVRQLKELFEKAVAEVGETNAMIFDIHQMMVTDLDYCESIENIIHTQQVNAEYAVGVTGDNFSRMFASMEDAYMKERAADVRDVSERLIGILSGSEKSLHSSEEPVIIMADDLVPSETVQLDKNKVLGFVTVHGSANSHTAILARTMNIPAVIQTDIVLKPEYDGMLAVLDGFEGRLILEPDEETLCKAKEKQKEENEKKQLLEQLKGQGNVTLDGKAIEVYANIGNLADMGSVLKNDAGGIGLFRSEFLYLENSDYPTEEQQFSVYKTVAENMAGKKVIIRTLDIGADKQADYFQLPPEENPAMGFRAIRICLERREVFQTQLRALFRASAFSRIAMMFPMITSVSEIREIKAIVEQVKQELKEEKLPFDENLEMGIMIETPAAALISDQLAKEVDFFSVGTNDLTQYTLAVDRQNPHLDRFYDAHHPAVLRMLKMIVDHAHQNGIWAGICGELAADLELTEAFLAMGFDELSVSPPYVLKLRKKIRETNLQECRDLLLRKIENGERL